MGHFLKSRIYSDVTGLRYIVQPCQLFTTPAFFVTRFFRSDLFPSVVARSSSLTRLLFDLLPDAGKKIELREDLKSRRGLAVSLEIICHNCGESTSTMSSKISNKCYDVNLRLTYGMRAIGKGGAAARIFCGLMNLPPPPAKFERHNSLFLNVLKTISEDSMNAAVHEAVIANDNNSNIAVAVDGTWHKRGYSSLNGVVCATSVENGKVIDFEALTKYCSSCKGKKTM
ncbi:uncharacterized protein TNCV_999111 [Trichonephila clavipes]|nr:uncharacterized protein TNCV_999111 [Trichonephila clavipes]